MKEKDINTTEYIKIIKESPEKKRSYIFFGFSILATIILIVFAIRPTITTISRINKEIKSKEKTDELLEKKIDTLSELDKEYAEDREKFDDLELVFPVGENHSLFLANIDAIVARNGFSLSSVKFDKYRGGDTLNTRVLVPQSVSFTVKGKQINLVSFLRELEDLPMYPVIDTLSYSTRQRGDGLSSFTINMKIYSVENDNFYN